MTSIEQVLAGDPSRDFMRMDASARATYLNAVDELANANGLPAVEVARRAIEVSTLASAMLGEPEQRSVHVGTVLVGHRREAFAKLLGAREPVRPSGTPRTYGARFARYMAIVLVGTISLLALVLHFLGWNLDGFGLVFAGAAWLIAISHVTVSLLYKLMSMLATPSPLLRMDFTAGIPDDCKTLVAIPSILSNEETIARLVADLERRFQQNPDRNISYCLLSDFMDSAGEHHVSDESLIASAVSKLKVLERRHGQRFFLLHRARRWNPSEELWMGWERKRGKLADLNDFLCTGDPAKFPFCSGDLRLLRDVRYVITLDMDVDLPQGSARRLVEIIAHPLNLAFLDVEKGRVTEGYGILQPRPRIGEADAVASLFTRLCAATDDRAITGKIAGDANQEFFGEGSYYGKGIYDIAAFRASMDRKIPENQVLSHDLLEGCFARCAIISDVEFPESHPRSYASDMSRRHRWVRGDWQLLPWLFPKVRGEGGVKLENPISALGRWKIFDNMRRSLVPIALTCLFIIGWLMSTQPLYWTLALVLTLALPAICITGVRAFLVRNEGAKKLRSVISASTRLFVLAVVGLSFSLFEGLLIVDAIARSTWRVCVSRKKILEWKQSNELRVRDMMSLIDYFNWMKSSPICSCGLFTIIWKLRPDVLPIALPILALWFVAPALAYALSKPLGRSKLPEA